MGDSTNTTEETTSGPLSIEITKVIDNYNYVEHYTELKEVGNKFVRIEFTVKANEDTSIHPYDFKFEAENLYYSESYTDMKYTTFKEGTTRSYYITVEIPKNEIGKSLVYEKLYNGRLTEFNFPINWSENVIDAKTNFDKLDIIRPVEIEVTNIIDNYSNEELERYLPEDGNKYIRVEFTITTNENIDVNSNYFKLETENSFYDRSSRVEDNINVDVIKSGGTFDFYIGYEIPENDSAFALVFDGRETSIFFPIEN